MNWACALGLVALGFVLGIMASVQFADWMADALAEGGRGSVAGRPDGLGPLPRQAESGPATSSEGVR